MAENAAMVSLCHSGLSDFEFIFRWFQSISLLAVNTSSLFQSPLMSVWAFPFTPLSFDHTLEKFKPPKCIWELFVWGWITSISCLLVLCHGDLSRNTYLIIGVVKYKNIWYPLKLRLRPPRAVEVFARIYDTVLNISLQFVTPEWCATD